jgi:hypothetical protein
MLFATLSVTLAIVGCGTSSAGGATRRYDIRAGKLCLSLASQLKSVVSQTTFGYTPPLGAPARPSFDAWQRERYIRGATQSATVVDSVRTELAAVSAPTSRTAAKRRFDVELHQGAAAFRAFAERLGARPTSDSSSASLVRSYAVGTLHALQGCRTRVRTYEQDELAHDAG